MLPPEPSLVFIYYKHPPVQKVPQQERSTGSLDIRAKSASITWRTGRSKKLAWIQNKVDAVQAPYR